MSLFHSKCPYGTFTAVNPHLLSLYRSPFYRQVSPYCWAPYYSSHLYPYAVETPYTTIPINPLTRTPLVYSSSAAHNRGTQPMFFRRQIYTENFPYG